MSSRTEAKLRELESRGLMKPREIKAKYLYRKHDTLYIRSGCIDDVYKILYDNAYNFVMKVNNFDFRTTSDCDASKLLIVTNVDEISYPTILVNNTENKYEDYYNDIEHENDTVHERIAEYNRRLESIDKLKRGNYRTLKNVSFDIFMKIIDLLLNSGDDYGNPVFEITLVAGNIYAVYGRIY